MESGAQETAGGSLEETVNRILGECGYRENPYFISLADGSFGRADFVETQVQFYFAVIFFSRPMAAVAAKIPHPRDRVEVLRNVWEEHGEGNTRVMHGETFLTLLDRLAGLRPEEVEGRALWPEVRAFNTTLVGACVLDEYVIGVGALGMIERMFVDISQWIGRGIVAREFVEAGRLIHYELHEELDVKHSQDFFDVLAPVWERSMEDRYYIEQGLRLGAYIFDRLYRDLYGARDRRWMTEHGNAGLHSRAR